MKMDATLSPDSLYRYTLVRDWRDDPMEVEHYAQLRSHPDKMLNMICLNPSTATATEDDPTVRRCIGFAKTLGYGGLTLTNIFAYRSTDPKQLYKTSDPVGPDNDDTIMTVAQESASTIIAWGNHGQYRDRGMRVIALLLGIGITPYCFGRTLSNQPKHPLYLRADSKPVVW